MDTLDPYRWTHAGPPTHPVRRMPEAAFVGGSEKACGAVAAEDSTQALAASSLLL